MIWGYPHFRKPPYESYISCNLSLLRWCLCCKPSENIKLQLSITFSIVGLGLIHQSGLIIFKPSEIVEPSWINGFCHSSWSETLWFFAKHWYKFKTSLLNPSFQYISFSGWIGVVVVWILLFNRLIWSRVQNMCLHPTTSTVQVDVKWLNSLPIFCQRFNASYHEMSQIVRLQWIVA